MIKYCLKISLLFTLKILFMKIELKKSALNNFYASIIFTIYILHVYDINNTSCVFKYVKWIRLRVFHSYEFEIKKHTVQFYLEARNAISGITKDIRFAEIYSTRENTKWKSPFLYILLFRIVETLHLKKFPKTSIFPYELTKIRFFFLYALTSILMKTGDNSSMPI